MVLCEGNLLVTCGYPTQNAINAEEVSMPWRRHVKGVGCHFLGTFRYPHVSYKAARSAYWRIWFDPKQQMDYTGILLQNMSIFPPNSKFTEVNNTQRTPPLKSNNLQSSSASPLFEDAAHVKFHPIPIIYSDSNKASTELYEYDASEWTECDV